MFYIKKKILTYLLFLFQLSRYRTLFKYRLGTGFISAPLFMVWTQIYADSDP